MLIFLRLLPTLLSWFIKKKYRLEAQIGRISIPYFVLHDILIKKNGFSVVSFLKICHKVELVKMILLVFNTLFYFDKKLHISAYR